MSIKNSQNSEKTGVSLRFQQLREFFKLRKNAFGDRIDVSPGYISDIESGLKNPSKRLLRVIASEFDISYDWLLTGQGEMNQTGGGTVSETGNSVGEDMSEYKRLIAEIENIEEHGTQEDKAVMDLALANIGRVNRGIRKALKNLPKKA